MQTVWDWARYLQQCSGGEVEDYLNEARRILGKKPVVEIANDQPLNWADIETLTKGTLGKHQGACPYCGPWKTRSTVFCVERITPSTARWICFYCDRKGNVQADGPIDPVALAQNRCKLAQERAQDKAKRTAQALQWWNEAQPIADTPVIKYLVARAITELPPDVNEVLRWHPSCPFGYDETRPCMLALYRDARTDKPCAVHRTWIEHNAVRNRKAYGPIAGAAIKLWPLTGDHLFIAEGIETALSAAAMTLREQQCRPMWAATVARNIGIFPVIPGVRQLTICADNDESGVGLDKAKIAQRRWQKARRNAELVMPERHKDLNDLLMELRRENG
jgi:Toprim domain